MQIVTQHESRLKIIIVGLLFLIGVLLTCPTKDDILDINPMQRMTEVNHGK